MKNQNIWFYYKGCETGSYGLNCTKNCAACLHDTDCHHVTGMCSSGCKKGWKDVEKCDKGIYFIPKKLFYLYKTIA